MIVLAHGVFDVLHYGHLIMLQHARRLAGEGSLVVTITADRFVRKGPGRPIFTQRERAAMLRALAMVDEVDVCNAASGIPMIQKWKPKIYLKHAEYKTHDSLGFLNEERRAVEAQGGELVFFPGRKWSSSGIISRVATWKEMNPVAA